MQLSILRMPQCLHGIESMFEQTIIEGAPECEEFSFLIHVTQIAAKLCVDVMESDFEQKTSECGENISDTLS